MLQLDNFYKARFVLSKVIRKTELVHTPRINPESDVFLKPECLQKTGSFKIRGAYYKISQLTPEEKAKGVIACSAGNHAQGVALGATAMGVKSLICLPEGAPISKVEAVVVPVGGGGLISGVAFAIKSLNPKVKIYGVQAEGAASMVQSLHDHKQEKLPSVATVADGIAVKEPGKLTFETCSKYVDEIVTVSEDEICAAILKLIESEKMVAEGAGAASVAAVMYNKVPVKGKKTICIVSGGNIDVTILNRVITRGLAKSGRLCTIEMELDDKPGELVEVCSVIASLGGNITGVHHDRSANRQKVNSCVLRLTMETRDADHVKEIKGALEEKGFHLYIV